MGIWSLVALGIVYGLNLLTTIPGIRNSPVWLVLLRSACVVIIAALALTEFRIAGWPLLVYVAFLFMWTTAQDLAWPTYLEVRMGVLGHSAAAADKRAQPMIAGLAGSAIAGAMAFPLFAWLWIGDMAREMVAAGLAESARDAYNLELRLIVAGVLAPTVVLAIAAWAARKNPWYPAQQAYLKAMFASGERRRESLAQAARLEPAVESK